MTQRFIQFTLLLGGLVCQHSRLNAQDIHFSQYYAAPQLVNPANAGLEYQVDINTIYRQQWKSVADPFTTYGISVSGNGQKNRGSRKAKKKGHWGFGWDCYYDKSGDAALVTLSSGLSIAYHVRLNKKSRLSAGIKGNFNQKSIKNPTFKWGTQYDGFDYNASLLSGESLQNLRTISFTDVSGGINYRIRNSERYISANDQKVLDIGLSGFHLNPNNNALLSGFSNPMQSRYMLYANALIGLSNTNVNMLPKFYFQIQGGHREAMVGALFSIKSRDESKVTGYVNASFFNIGLLYRVKDAFVGVAQFELHNYMISISYDVNVSKLTPASGGRGAMEVTLRYISRGHFLRKGAHKGYGNIF